MGARFYPATKRTVCKEPEHKYPVVSALIQTVFSTRVGAGGGGASLLFSTKLVACCMPLLAVVPRAMHQPACFLGRLIDLSRVHTRVVAVVEVSTALNSLPKVSAVFGRL